MMASSTLIESYLTDETGVIMVDWVALTAGLLILGTIIVHTVFDNGVKDAAFAISDVLSGQAELLTDVVEWNNE